MCIGILWLLLISQPFNVNTEYAHLFANLTDEVKANADNFPDLFLVKTTTTTEAPAITTTTTGKPSSTTTPNVEEPVTTVAP